MVSDRRSGGVAGRDWDLAGGGDRWLGFPAQMGRQGFRRFVLCVAIAAFDGVGGVLADGQDWKVRISYVTLIKCVIINKCVLYER